MPPGASWSNCSTLTATRTIRILSVHAREIVVQSRAALRVERFLCRYFAARVIAVSFAVAAQLDPANVIVLDEYLEPGEFSPTHAGRFRTRVPIPDDVPVIGAVARLD